jgi:hypothetical protein
MASSHFSTVVVIESLPSGDRHTGRRLREDIEVHSVFHQRGLSVEFAAADTAERFWGCLAHALQDASTRADYPLLHIESHGSTDTKGLVLADGSFVGWDQLKPVLTAINVATRCNLFVALAACYGAYLGQIILPTDRAPLWGMLAPTESAKPNDLLGSFLAFYTTLLASLDGDRALSALIAAESRTANYYFVSAEGFFKKAYVNYLAQHSSEKAYYRRAKDVRLRLRELGVRRRPTVFELRQRLRATERPSFDKYHRAFFMTDLYPENAGRFTEDFDQIIKEARALKCKRVASPF